MALKASNGTTDALGRESKTSGMFRVDAGNVPTSRDEWVKLINQTLADAGANASTAKEITDAAKAQMEWFSMLYPPEPSAGFGKKFQEEK